jgi:hypothetical protein
MNGAPQRDAPATFPPQGYLLSSGSCSQESCFVILTPWHSHFYKPQIGLRKTKNNEKKQ